MATQSQQPWSLLVFGAKTRSEQQGFSISTILVTLCVRHEDKLREHLVLNTKQTKALYPTSSNCQELKLNSANMHRNDWI